MNSVGTNTAAFGSTHTSSPSASNFAFGSNTSTISQQALKVVRKKIGVVPEKWKPLILNVDKTVNGPLGYVDGDTYYRFDLLGYILEDIGLVIIYEERFIDREADYINRYFNPKKTYICVKETVSVEKFLEKYFVDLL